MTVLASATTTTDPTLDVKVGVVTGTSDAAVTVTVLVAPIALTPSIRKVISDCDAKGVDASGLKPNISLPQQSLVCQPQPDA